MVFAVATSDSVLLYDTQQLAPFGRIVDIHFTRLTDLAWSNDGRILMVSSTDGYCSFITFEKGEIGVVYGGELSLAPKLFGAGNSEAQSKKRNRKKKSVENKENTTAEEENPTAKEQKDVAKPDAHDNQTEKTKRRAVFAIRKKISTGICTWAVMGYGQTIIRYSNVFDEYRFAEYSLRLSIRYSSNISPKVFDVSNALLPPLQRPIR
ncbi:unnamed protein product [Cyprideis torosa]|uniref:CAF1B/HIR1 beta-propeller domain-containing protein n=1 Tax=Cyprideis torosa TaxID=163714 RepID=A0A7R8WMM3_9CRUS|nr:unnamed protein product [Cyprideis torosa]CAG0903820.1 unnamed protein product [Cyprideis torosa]